MSRDSTAARRLGPDAASPANSPNQRGRKRDHSRDPAILQATLDVLAETGYEGMTVDQVAIQATVSKGMLYRRWATKEELVLAAIASLGHPLEREGLPDTGRLRSDLLALIDSRWLGGADRRIEVLAGVSSLLMSSTTLAEAIHAQITQPYVAAYSELLRRAVERREIPETADLQTLAQVVPAFSTHQLMFMKRPLDRAFYVSVIDHVLLPAVGL